MKRLMLLRHAESPSSFDLQDHERVLSDKGKRDAQALGQYMARHDLARDLVLCSDAVRTKQTWDGVLQSIDAQPAVSYEAQLYRGSIADYLDILAGQDDAHNSVLIVGHNPVMHGLSAKLGRDDSPAFSSLMQGYAPGTLTVLECGDTPWALVVSQRFSISTLVSPADYYSD